MGSGSTGTRSQQKRLSLSGEAFVVNVEVCLTFLTAELLRTDQRPDTQQDIGRGLRDRLQLSARIVLHRYEISRYLSGGGSRRTFRPCADRDHEHDDRNY